MKADEGTEHSLFEPIHISTQPSWSYKWWIAFLSSSALASQERIGQNLL